MWARVLLCVRVCGRGGGRGGTEEVSCAQQHRRAARGRPLATTHRERANLVIGDARTVAKTKCSAVVRKPRAHNIRTHRHARKDAHTRTHAHTHTRTRAHAHENAHAHPLPFWLQLVRAPLPPSDRTPSAPPSHQQWRALASAPRRRRLRSRACLRVPRSAAELPSSAASAPRRRRLRSRAAPRRALASAPRRRQPRSRACLRVPSSAAELPETRGTVILPEVPEKLSVS